MTEMPMEPLETVEAPPVVWLDALLRPDRFFPRGAQRLQGVWLAGVIFDANGSYAGALLAAGAAALLAALACATLPRVATAGPVPDR